MSQDCYYGGDLSCCSSRSEEEEDDSYTEEDAAVPRRDGVGTNAFRSPFTNTTTRDDDGLGMMNSPFTSRYECDLSSNHNLWSRVILHLDVDCFYCQCEELDRRLDKNVPLAIGQKHIVVTCNYAARARGVTKLQLRTQAKKVCPDLLIVEGSDLERYRQHSRAIYNAFRKCLKQISEEMVEQSEPAAKGIEASQVKIPVQKTGGMDEIIADITAAVIFYQQRQPQDSAGPSNLSDESFFIFGQNTTTEIVLVEDQTGQKTVVDHNYNPDTLQLLPANRRNVHEKFGSHLDHRECQSRLLVGAHLIANRLRQFVLQQTGFTTSIGISVNPMLSKLAILQKPNCTNVLYPWKSPELLYSMPLRKVPKIGRGTIRALESTLQDQYWHDQQSKKANPSSRRDITSVVWTVRDLLRVPRPIIIDCLKRLPAFQTSTTSERHCEVLVNRCRGLDNTTILDDQGGLSKTLSVENSFRRGTIMSMKDLWKELDDLCRRLPRLLRDRISWSNQPSHAYPTTLRVTIRTVVPNNTNHRPKVTGRQLQLQQNLQPRRRLPTTTCSKQSTFDGKTLLNLHEQLLKEPETCLYQQSQFLNRYALPLVRQLCSDHCNNKTRLDVTRLNLALTNFQDVSKTTSTTTTTSSSPEKACMLFQAAFGNKQNGVDVQSPSIVKGRQRSDPLTISVSQTLTNPQETSRPPSSATNQGKTDRKRMCRPISSTPKQVYQRQGTVSVWAVASRQKPKCISSSKNDTNKVIQSSNQNEIHGGQKDPHLYHQSSWVQNCIPKCSSQIDASVMAELPQEVAEEIKRSYHFRNTTSPTSRKRTKIDHFFSKSEKEK